MGDVPRVELFARQSPPGWDVWGNEVEAPSRTSGQSVQRWPGRKGGVKIPYVNVPNDLSKIKTKLAFNLTKRQLVCFGIAAAVGIPSYLLARGAIGNTGAMFLMMGWRSRRSCWRCMKKTGSPLKRWCGTSCGQSSCGPG